MLSKIIRQILESLSFFLTNDMQAPKQRDKLIYKELNNISKKKNL